MVGDMFMTKEQLLETWAKQKVVFSKAEIMDYGLKNYYLRADRTIRALVAEGRIRRIDPKECAFRGLTGKMAWYEYKGGIEDARWQELDI